MQAAPLTREIGFWRLVWIVTLGILLAETITGLLALAIWVAIQFAKNP